MKIPTTTCASFAYQKIKSTGGMAVNSNIDIHRGLLLMDIKHQRGLYSEMIAAAELTRQGHEVLFGMADNGLVDLVAINATTGISHCMM